MAKKIYQFLKPSWKKIILTIILLFIPTPLYTTTLCNDPLVSSCPKEFHFLPAILSFGNNLIFGIISLMIAYLVSCFIFWVYGRIRK